MQPPSSLATPTISRPPPTPFEFLLHLFPLAFIFLALASVPNHASRHEGPRRSLDPSLERHLRAAGSLQVLVLLPGQWAPCGGRVAGSNVAGCGRCHARSLLSGRSTARVPPRRRALALTCGLRCSPAASPLSCAVRLRRHPRRRGGLWRRLRRGRRAKRHPAPGLRRVGADLARRNGGARMCRRRRSSRVPQCGGLRPRAGPVRLSPLV
jgi:hypothetical protein